MRSERVKDFYEPLDGVYSTFHTLVTITGSDNSGFSSGYTESLRQGNIQAAKSILLKHITAEKDRLSARIQSACNERRSREDKEPIQTARVMEQLGGDLQAVYQFFYSEGLGMGTFVDSLNYLNQFRVLETNLDRAYTRAVSLVDAVELSDLQRRLSD